MKRVFLFLVSILMVGMFTVGCSQTANISTTTIATPPAGTTQVKLSGGNVSVSGSTLSFALTVLDQSNTAIGSQYFGVGNISGGIYTSAADATAGTNAVATVTITTLTGGSASTSKKVAAALVLDSTGSMGGSKISSMESAAKSFLTAATSDTNKAALISITSSVNVVAPMQVLTTSNVSAMNTLIDGFYASGGTPLYDAMAVGISTASKETAATDVVRAAIAMSDGGEGGSTTFRTTGEVIALAQKYNIPVYTVGLYANSSEAASYGPAMRSIATATTGSDAGYFELIVGSTSTGSMSDLYNKLAVALTQSYTTTATLSTALTSGTTYVMKVTLVSYGSFTGQTAYITFTVI